MKTEQIESFCPEDTFALGEKIGRLAEPGTVLTFCLLYTSDAADE